MAKKGNSAHTKRISLGRNLKVEDRKGTVWLTTSKPGPHAKNSSMPLSMLLRDEVCVCSDLKEVKKLLNRGGVLIDGKAVKDYRRTIGIMDIISIPSMKKAYRMQIICSQLRAKEITEQQAKAKLCKVISKRTDSGAKITLTLHDGRNLIADNKVKTGSTLKMSVPEFKLEEQIELKEGAKCFVIKGKHAGKIATLNKVSQRAGAMPTRAELSGSDGDFITLTKYLIAVDDEFVK